MKQYIDPDPFQPSTASPEDELNEIRTLANQARFGASGGKANLSKAALKMIERQCPKASVPSYKPRDKKKAKAAKASKRKNRNK